jgi:hypothetical protein
MDEDEDEDEDDDDDDPLHSTYQTVCIITYTNQY